MLFGVHSFFLLCRLYFIATVAQKLMILRSHWPGCTLEIGTLLQSGYQSPTYTLIIDLHDLINVLAKITFIHCYDYLRYSKFVSL